VSLGEVRKVTYFNLSKDFDGVSQLDLWELSNEIDFSAEVKRLLVQTWMQRQELKHITSQPNTASISDSKKPVVD